LPSIFQKSYTVSPAKLPVKKQFKNEEINDATAKILSPG